MKKILFIMIMLINSITTSSQNSEHVYHFDFDGRCVSYSGEFKKWESCSNCFMEFHDRISLLQLVDTRYGNYIFDVTKMEHDKQSNAMILTCTNKGETTTECTVIMGKEFILFVYDDVALKYHIQNARQIK